MIKKLIALGILSISLIGLNPISVNAEWRLDNYGWWYTQGSSWCTGWNLIDGKWYYFYSNGYMASDTIIDGYYVDQSGAWVECNQSNIDTARDLIYQEDGNFVTKSINDNNAAGDPQISLRYIGEGAPGKFLNTNAWNINETYGYVFSLGNEYSEVCGYFVGKDTYNVYCIPHQGGLSLYKMKNNKIDRIYKDMYDPNNSYEWRK